MYALCMQQKIVPAWHFYLDLTCVCIVGNHPFNTCSPSDAQLQGNQVAVLQFCVSGPCCDIMMHRSPCRIM